MLLHEQLNATQEDLRLANERITSERERFKNTKDILLQQIATLKKEGPRM
jgi:hypothetical protein